LAKPEVIANETRAIKKLCSGSHPNIVEVLRIGELKNSAYYFIDMELCDINLQDYIHQDDSKPLPEAIPYFVKNATSQVKALQIWNIVKQIATGVAFIQYRATFLERITILHLKCQFLESQMSVNT